MFGELPRVFKEVSELLQPVEIVHKEEKNAVTGILYKAQYVRIPKLDMKQVDYNLNNLMILKDFYDFGEYPAEHVACLVMAHNVSLLFLALKGVKELLHSPILNSSMTCEEFEKDITKLNPYASLLLYKGFKESRMLRKAINAKDMEDMPEAVNKELRSLKIIDGPLIDFNRNFRRFCQLKAKQGKQLKEHEQETLQLLNRYFDEEKPKHGYQVNPYTELGIILV